MQVKFIIPVERVSTKLTHGMSHEATTFALIAIHLWITSVYMLIQLRSSIKLLFTNKYLHQHSKLVTPANMLQQVTRSSQNIKHSPSSLYCQGREKNCKASPQNLENSIESISPASNTITYKFNSHTKLYYFSNIILNLIPIPIQSYTRTFCYDFRIAR